MSISEFSDEAYYILGIDLKRKLFLSFIINQKRQCFSNLDFANFFSDETQSVNKKYSLFCILKVCFF